MGLDNFPPPSQQLPPPSSPNLSLLPLDLTLPTLNMSESDISNDLFDPHYDDTDDDYGIPLKRPPSRHWFLAMSSGSTENKT